MQALGKDVRDLLALLDKHGVRYLIVGGFAVAVHGTPRYTKDLDIWVECSSDNANRLVRVLEDFGFASLGVTTVDFETPDLVVQLGYEPNRGGSRTMSDREIAKIVRVARLTAVDERAERHTYWAGRSPGERFLEVESLRRMWIEITGDPDLPIQRVIQRRPLRHSS